MTPKIIPLALCFILTFQIFNGCVLKDKIFSPSEKQEESAKPSAVAAPKEAGKIVSLESEISTGQVNILLRSDKKIQYSAYKLPDPERLMVELENTEPGNFQNPLIVDQGGVRKVTPMYFPESNSTRVEVALDKPTEYNIDKRDENSIAIEIKNPSTEKAAGGAEVVPVEKTAAQKAGNQPVAGKQESAPKAILAQESPNKTNGAAKEEGALDEEFIFSETGPKTYTGQRVSLDFQNADVKNILRLLAEVSGLNVITTPEVQGTVTMRLMNVPWDQALDIVLKNNNLGMTREGNIIRVATKAQVDQEKQARLESRKKLIEEKTAKIQAEPLITETVKINYADIDKLSANLDGLKSERGKITVDQRTFTLILVDVKESLKKMQDLIHILDTPPKQVSIEARIVEVKRNYSKQLGIRWGGNADMLTNSTFPNNIGLNGGAGGNYVVDLPAAAGAGAGGALGVVLGHVVDGNYLDIQLSALESAGKGKIISNPRITTKDNVQASIESGNSIPYETVSQDGTATEWKNATIKLATTPHITPDGYVSLVINAAKDEPDSSIKSTSGVPSISTRTVTTEIIVRNGDTIVLGGLFKKTATNTNKGVPWLSRVPALGWLFKNKDDVEGEEELLIFITPRILERDSTQG
ncbi:MAG: type IV pilus secretin PilQ [Nitrospinae bacterium]|nr:type IV pilus secretin PilQ [Nitrospinota bacterium]